MPTVREDDIKLEETTFPEGLLFARNTALPLLQIEDALGVALWFSKESERVITAPLLAIEQNT